MSEGQTEASVYQQAENGKTELSLVHFTLKNPRWQPPQDSSLFISHMREKVQHDAQAGPNPQLLLSEAPLCTSLLSNDSATAVGLSLYYLNFGKILFSGGSSHCPVLEPIIIIF